MRLHRLGFALALSTMFACGGAETEPPAPRRPDLVSPALSCTQGPMVAGIDVSHGDGTIDWSAVKSAGFAFAYAKATEGITYQDPEFQTNWTQMKSAGVIRGAYHFFHPDDDGTAQADAYLAQVGTFEPGDLPPMLDWEVDDCSAGQECPSSDATLSGCYSLSAQTQSALAFIAEIKAVTGLTTTVYTYPNFWNCLDNPAWAEAYPLFQASYPSSAATTGPLPPSGMCPAVLSPWSTFTLWQWTANGSVAGNSTVDFDAFNGTLAQLQAFTVQGGGSAGGSGGGSAGGSGGGSAGGSGGSSAGGSGGGSAGGSGGGSAGGSGGSTGGSGGGAQCPSGYSDVNGACVPTASSSGCDVSGQRTNVLFGLAALLVALAELRRLRNRQA